ncbi:unnamed protein product [Peronospora farinosa]|uniref:Uncharacterized protein n=1 Tax=Peronospora farinosa TaxID=134698 RepID=A0ABN8C783_9STRA|nr:unnamed protein product [Peronospora farinosa]
MHLRFGMIWATIATILVGLGTSAEQSRSARLLGSEVPAKRKLRSDNLINDNKEERTPDLFSFEDFFVDKFPETIDEILSSVPHQHSDPAVSAVAEFHPPPHQQSDAAVSTFPHQQFDAAVSTVPHQQFDAAVPTIDGFRVPHDDVKDQLDIVYEYAGATRCKRLTCTMAGEEYVITW